MSKEPGSPEPYTYEPAPQRPFWTAARIVALALVVVIAVSAVGAGMYYYAVSPVPPSRVCNNDATNYPLCTTCSSGQTLVNGTCTNNCTNGATNPPSCNSFQTALTIHRTVIITSPIRPVSALLSTSAMLNTRRIPLVGILPSTFKTTVQIEVSRYHQPTLTKRTNRQQNLFTSTSMERLFPARGLSHRRSIPT